MIFKFLIGFLVFDGVAAVLFWLLFSLEARAVDRKNEEAFKSRDHAIDDGFRAQDDPSDELQTRPQDRS